MRIVYFILMLIVAFLYAVYLVHLYRVGLTDSLYMHFLWITAIGLYIVWLKRRTPKRHD